MQIRFVPVRQVDADGLHQSDGAQFARGQKRKPNEAKAELRALYDRA
jgi:hypothetical protein